MKKIINQTKNLYLTKIENLEFLTPENNFGLKEEDISQKSKSFWLNIIKKGLKSVLLYGEQGSGKTHFINQVASYINKEKKFKNYKIIYIKSWDYDFENKPFLLFLKRLYYSNVLKKHYQTKLHTIIILLENQRHPLISKHLLIDIAKDFLFTCKVKDNKEVLFIVDELERCHPKFALELLEVITKYTGVEFYIDKNNFKQEYFKNSPLFINNCKVIWIFDKKILNNVVLKNCNNNLDKYWSKYFQKEIKLEPTSKKEVLKIIAKQLGINHIYFNKIEKFCEMNFLNNKFFQNLRKMFYNKIKIRKYKKILESLKEQAKKIYNEISTKENANIDKDIFSAFLICSFILGIIHRFDSTIEILRNNFKSKVEKKFKNTNFSIYNKLMNVIENTYREFLKDIDQWTNYLIL